MYKLCNKTKIINKIIEKAFRGKILYRRYYETEL